MISRNLKTTKANIYKKSLFGKNKKEINIPQLSSMIIFLSSFPRIFSAPVADQRLIKNMIRVMTNKI